MQKKRNITTHPYKVQSPGIITQVSTQLTRFSIRAHHMALIEATWEALITEIQEVILEAVSIRTTVLLFELEEKIMNTSNRRDLF